MKKIIILLSAVLMLIAASFAVNAIIIDGTNLGDSNLVPGHMIQLPRLSDDWIISAQNVGTNEVTFILALFDEEYNCPPQNAGLLKVECAQASVGPNEVYHWDTTEMLDSPARFAASGLLFTVETGPYTADLCANVAACMTTSPYTDGISPAWLCVHKLFTAYQAKNVWEGHLSDVNFGGMNIEDSWAAASVTIIQPDDLLEYTGFSEANEGNTVVIGPIYPYSEVYVQNSGDSCISLEPIFCNEMGSCTSLPDELSIATGISRKLDVSAVSGTGFVKIQSKGKISAVAETDGAMFEGVYPDRQTPYLLAPFVQDGVVFVYNLDETSAKVKAVYYNYKGDIIQTWVTSIPPNSYEIFNTNGPRGYMTIENQDGGKLTGTYLNPGDEVAYTLMTYSFNSLELYKSNALPWWTGYVGEGESQFSNTAYYTNFVKTPGNWEVSFGFANQNGFQLEVCETFNEKDQESFSVGGCPMSSSWNIATGKYNALCAVTTKNTVPEIAFRGVVYREIMVQCFADGDCGEDFCVDGYCVECRESEDCKEGYVCEDGVCVEENGIDSFGVSDLQGLSSLSRMYTVPWEIRTNSVCCLDTNIGASVY